MYEIKKIGKVFTSKFVGTGPSSFKKKNLPGRGLTKVEKHWSMRYFFIFHTISPTDYLHPSTEPQLQTSKLLLTYFPKCPSYNNVQKCDTDIQGGARKTGPPSRRPTWA